MSKLIDVENDKLVMHKHGSRVLKKLERDRPVNLAFVFGNARSGKSFMMNQLLKRTGMRPASVGQGDDGSEDAAASVFQVMNSAEPCTRGVDVCGTFVPQPRMAAFVKDGTSAAADDGGDDDKKSPLVGFVDVEGAGDKDTTYDTLLALPLLLTSRVVLFNHKGAPTVQDMLTRLGVLARAAEYVELPDGDDDDGGGGGDGGNSAGGADDSKDAVDDDDDDATDAADGDKKKKKKKATKFGALHVLFRDYHFDADEDAVRSQLLDRERVVTKGKKKDDMSVVAARERNSVRKLLLANFSDIRVWLFRQPATSELLKEHKELPDSCIDPAFAATADALAAVITEQCAGVTQFNGRPLTTTRLHPVLAQLTRTLNTGTAVNVSSVFVSMERESIGAVTRACLHSLDARAQMVRVALPLHTDAVATMFARDVRDKTLAQFDDALRECSGTVDDERVSARRALLLKINARRRALRDENIVALNEWATGVTATAFADARAALDAWCEDRCPVDDDADIERHGVTVVDDAMMTLRIECDGVLDLSEEDGGATPLAAVIGNVDGGYVPSADEVEAEKAAAVAVVDDDDDSDDDDDVKASKKKSGHPDAELSLALPAPWTVFNDALVQHRAAHANVVATHQVKNQNLQQDASLKKLLVEAHEMQQKMATQAEALAAAAAEQAKVDALLAETEGRVAQTAAEVEAAKTKAAAIEKAATEAAAAAKEREVAAEAAAAAKAEAAAEEAAKAEAALAAELDALMASTSIKELETTAMREEAAKEREAAAARIAAAETAAAEAATAAEAKLAAAATAAATERTALLAKAAAEKDALGDASDSLQQQLNDRDRTIARLEAELTEKESEVDVWRNRVRDTNREGGAKSEAMAAELVEAQTATTTAQQQLRERVAECETLTARVATLEAEAAAAAAAPPAVDDAVGAERDALKAELSELQTAHKTLQKIYDKAVAFFVNEHAEQAKTKWYQKKK